MHQNNYIYSFNYDITESDLCKLESRHLFGKEEKNKSLFSDIKADPAISAFIKKRLDIISSSEDYSTLLDQIKNAAICTDGFKVEYLVLEGDATEYADRLVKVRALGYCVEGDSDYYNPTITYALCNYNGAWYFGTLIKNNFDWHKHKDKPHSFSNSITISIAKALVNIAAKSLNNITLLDACCGAGTIMLEACFAGKNIDGCDINWKMCKYARENLSHFNYVATIYRSDIKEITNSYDAAIIDLPYNLYSRADDAQILHIIESTAEIANRIVIVSTSDISGFISKAGLIISDSCEVRKKGKAIFIRKIWVCEKNDQTID